MAGVKGSEAIKVLEKGVSPITIVGANAIVPILDGPISGIIAPLKYRELYFL